MNHARLFYVIAISFGAVALAMHSYSVRRISHDDGISYLAATGHQGMYSTSAPTNIWTSAGEWQALWSPSEFGVFRIIARDLAEYDIHPPLYFWMLHIWSHLYGITLQTGPFLNIPFHILACLAITAACRLLKCPPIICGIAGLLWLFSGSHLLVSTEARQYSLLGMMSAAFLLSLLRFVCNPNYSKSIWLCLTCALGMLTHYHFILLLTVCCGMAGGQLILTKRWRTLSMLAGVVLLASVAFLIMHPTFYLSFGRASSQAQPFAWSEIPNRIRLIQIALLEMVLPNRFARIMTYLTWRHWLPSMLLAITGIGIAVLTLIKHATKETMMHKIKCFTTIPFVSSLGCLFLIALLYVTCRSPRHAMGAKYLILVSPLLFVFLGQVLAWLYSRHRAWATVSLWLLLTVQTAFSAQVTHAAFARGRNLSNHNPLQMGAALIIDSTARGVLPTVVWHAPSEMAVFASRQSFLLTDGLPELPDNTHIYYASSLDYGNSLPERESILDKFASKGYSYRKLPATRLWSATVYELERAEQESGHVRK